LFAGFENDLTYLIHTIPGINRCADNGYHQSQLRGGKSAYWCSFGEKWESRLLDVLKMVMEK
jgi:hypothetical protein